MRRRKPVRRLRTGATEFRLVVDDLDANAIIEAVATRAGLEIPPTTHDDANRIGRVLAEVCRGYLELLDMIDEEEL